MARLGKVCIDSGGFLFTSSMAERASGLTDILFFTFGAGDSIDNISGIQTWYVWNVTELHILKDLIRISPLKPRGWHQTIHMSASSYKKCDENVHDFKKCWPV